MKTNGKPTLDGCSVLPPMEMAPKQTLAKRDGKRRKAGERFAVLNAFVDTTAGTLSRSEILVWLTLFRDCRDGTARTGQADIARRTGLATRTVRWSLRRLESRGLVTTVYRGGLGRGASRYRVFPVSQERQVSGNRLPE